jgi:GTP-binding protein
MHFEGPITQTRFGLKKAIDLGLKPCVVISKVDKEKLLLKKFVERFF